MRLNDSYLGIWYETDTEKTLKKFFLDSHLDERNKSVVATNQIISQIKFPDKHYKRVKSDDWWEERVRIANLLVKRPKSHKIYFLTKKVQEDAELIKFDKIDLKWFNSLSSGEFTYMTGKNEFFRFDIEERSRINILNYRIEESTQGDKCLYDSYSIILGTGELATLPTQNNELAIKFIKCLLYIELGDISSVEVKAKIGKVKFGIKGDDKLKNDSGLDVVLINSTWNKTTILVGESVTTGHFRIQPYGPRDNTYYKVKWIKEYTRGSFIRGASKFKHTTN